MKQLPFLLATLLLVAASTAHSVTIPLTATIDGAQASAGTGTSPGSGTATLTFDTDSNELAWDITWQDLTGTVTVAHFHGPAAAGANAGVAQGISIATGAGSQAGTTAGSATLSASQASDLRNGLWYINIHSTAVGSGEIRGQVLPVPCEATVLTRQLSSTHLWALLSVPCEAPEDSTMADLINDPAVSGDPALWSAWIYQTSGASGQYQQLLASDPIPAAGTGFWFTSSVDVTLTMPAGSTSSYTSNDAPCASGQPCFSRSVDYQSSWNLLGNPTSSTIRYVDAMLTNDTPALGCSAMTPCALDDAVINATLFQYNEFSQSYIQTTDDGTATNVPPRKRIARPWDGYWARFGDNGITVNSNWQLLERLFPSQFIFVTDTTVQGDLIDAAGISSGGVAGANAICQAEAKAGGLPGNYKAYISDANSSPMTALTQFTTPYLRPDGLQFATDFTQLTNGTAGGSVLAANPAITASLQLGPLLDSTNIGFAWTATESGLLSGSTCNDWSSNSDDFMADIGAFTGGLLGGMGVWESAFDNVAPCNVSLPFYCVTTQ